MPVCLHKVMYFRARIGLLGVVIIYYLSKQMHGAKKIYEKMLANESSAYLCTRSA